MTNQYFQGLNYSLANEDTRIEYKLAPEDAQSFFCVCGSGSRVIPLLAKNPKKLHIVDLSSAQLRLFRLRLSAIKVLSYDEYLFFLGYRQKSEVLDRRVLLNKLNLDIDDLKYWNYFEKDWKNDGFIYLGRWEKHFMKLGKFYQKFFFKNLLPLFETSSLADQLKRLPHLWSKRLFNFYTNIVLNPWVANKMLYKGHFAGSEEKRTTPLSAADYVANEFNDLFETTWVKCNYFLQLIFLGKISFEEAFPIECDVEIFNKIKLNRTEIIYHQDNLLTLLKQSPHDFYSLSDTFSYMSDSEVSSFLTGLPDSVPIGAQIIIRTFMRKPHFKLELPWKTNEELNLKLAKEDCTRMYEFCVLKKS